MIKIKNLHHRYPDGTYVLKGINLTISKGELFLICGPNGSGKTTLLRLMAGLMNPSKGEIYINGFNTSSRMFRKMVGIVFQDPDTQIVGETVREDIAFGPENMGLSKKEIEERVNIALTRMGLKGLEEKPCYLLSGGEKRRLTIAGVMAMQPDVILFDEPFSHLDYPGIRELLMYLLQLHKDGHTIVITTHDVEKIIAHVDRIAILKDGEIKVSGPPQENLLRALPEFGLRPPCYIIIGGDKISWLE